MQVRTSLLFNALAGGWGKISTIVFRLIQVPILLSMLGVDEFGRWLVLSSMPTWLMLANLGFGNVAANEMSMATAAGDLVRARVAFATVSALVATIVVAGSLLAAGIAPFLPWERLLDVSSARHEELAAAAIWLAMATLLSFGGEVYGGRFRAARKAHLGMLLGSVRPWLDLLAMLVALHFTVRFDYLAFSLLVSTAGIMAVSQFVSYRAMPSLTFSFADIRPSRFRDLFQKGLAFQAFPLGNAMLFQGNLLIVQVILGPAAVALFGTARTLVRSVNQLMELVNQVIWPELSHLLGAGDLRKAARLHRAGVGISVISASFCVAVLAVVGDPLYEFWTRKAMTLPLHLLWLFLLPIPFNALWFTSSVIHTACNQHEGLAVRYLIATSLAALACAGLSYYKGIEGAALSTLAVDLVLIPYVLKRSLRLTGDTWSGFMIGLWTELRGLPEAVIQLVNHQRKRCFHS